MMGRRVAPPSGPTVYPYTVSRVYHLYRMPECAFKQIILITISRRVQIENAL